MRKRGEEVLKRLRCFFFLVLPLLCSLAIVGRKDSIRNLKCTNGYRPYDRGYLLFTPFPPHAPSTAASHHFPNFPALPNSTFSPSSSSPSDATVFRRPPFFAAAAVATFFPLPLPFFSTPLASPHRSITPSSTSSALTSNPYAACSRSSSLGES